MPNTCLEKHNKIFRIVANLNNSQKSKSNKKKRLIIHIQTRRCYRKSSPRRRRLKYVSITLLLD